MDSIVILGDVRYHNFTNAPGAAKAPTYAGGVFLVDTAIKKALGLSSIADPPERFCPEPPGFEVPALDRRSQDYQTDGVTNWSVSLSNAASTGERRYILGKRAPIGECILPICGTPLLDMLDEWTSADECSPHILVIDDLGIQFRDECKFNFREDAKDGRITNDALLKARAKHLATIENLKAEAAKSTATEPRSTEALHRLLADAQSQARDFTALVMSKLFHGLSTKSDDVSLTGTKYPAEPIAVVSIAGAVPKIRPVDWASAAKNSYLDYLHSERALRRRTVVVLDAASLRECISISSGLSWERTALDAVVEMRRHPLIQDYLRFGFVIVRFGVSGMLLLENDQHGKVTHRLYFAPEEDDRAFSLSDEQTVLGSGAILVATIVEQLNSHCKWRSGKAILPDLSKSIDRACRQSVNRLVNHFELGYGRNTDEFNARRTDISRSVFGTQTDLILQQAGLASGLAGEQGLPQSPPKTSSVSTQRVEVASYRSRHWSILSSSSQATLNDVAREIVLYGPSFALNALEDSSHYFVEAWTRVSSQSISEHLYEFEDESRPSSVGEILLTKLRELSTANEHALSQSIGMQQSAAASKLHTALERFPGCLSALDYAANALIRQQIVVARKCIETVPQELYEIDQVNDYVTRLSEAIEYADDEELILCIRELRKMCSAATSRLKEGQADLVRKWLRLLGEARVEDPLFLLRRGLFKLFESFEPPAGWIPAISTPVLRLGSRPTEAGQSDDRMLVIDRKEIESIRAIKRTIEQYLIRSKSSGNSRPLSIGVFGPPGAGKSIAVKKIIEEMRVGHKLTKMKTINLSTLSDVKELHQKIQAIAAESRNAKELPMIFFDEFDSALDSEKLGWLKYFLSIMEDGEQLVEAVFVFAGGTSSSFESFSLKDRSTSDNLWIEFAERKGPDFVSRLMGHINVVGINAIDPDDEIFLIRRALMLRFMLQQEQGLKESEKAKIDPQMLNALLHVPFYHHGARSMRMLVDLCRQRSTNYISMSEVPPIHQLDMQVDGKSFAALASGQIWPLDSRSEHGSSTAKIDVFKLKTEVWSSEILKSFTDLVDETDIKPDEEPPVG